MRFLKAASIILLSSAICSCHTQKQVSLAESSIMTETVADKSTSVAGTKSVTVADVAGFFDNVVLSFSADSIRMGDVIIYGPQWSASADSANVSSKSMSMQEHNDSIVQDIASVKSVATNSDFSQSSKSVAIADTGSSFSWGFAIGAFIILALLISWYYSKFHK